MIRFILLPLFALIVFVLIVNFFVSDIDKEKKKRLIRGAAIFFISIGVFLTSFTFWKEWNVAEKLVEIGFNNTEGQIFKKSAKEYEVALVYSHGFMSGGRTVPRFDITLKSQNKVPNLRSLFCEDIEYDRFIKNQYGGWYPTPEVKLQNGHFVGKCYPLSIVNQVKKLPTRLNNFVPRNARYLFLPRRNELNQQVMHFYTEDLDASSLDSRLAELLVYYEIILSAEQK